MSAIPPEIAALVAKAWAVQDFAEGERILAEACRLYPDHGHLRTCHAAALGYCARFAEARAAFDALLRDTPPAKRLHMHGLLGVEWCRIGRHDLAVPLLRTAIAIPPGAMTAVAPVYEALADALLHLREHAEARKVARRGLRLYPGHPGLLVVLARALRVAGQPDEAADTARRVIMTLNASPEAIAQAGHELGHALDAQGRYADAFAAYQSAKAALRPAVKEFLPLWQARMEQLRTPDGQPSRADYDRWDADAGTDAGAPPLAFLVGIPRSGTTLLERVLDAHPGLVSVSETPVFSNMWNLHLRAVPACRTLVEALGPVTPERREAGRAVYLAGIRQAADRPVEGRMILDKHPSSLPNVPVIHRYFPGAKVLMALRDPRAVAWSCYVQYLPMNSESAAFNRFDTLGAHIAAHLRLWLHTRARLPPHVWHETRYESLVSDFAGETRRTLEFLGLPWSDDVAAFHTNPSPVRSPTYAEAAKPIFTGSVEKWRHYADYMTDAMPALESVMGDLGY